MIANFEVATGKLISPSVGDTRTEGDFVAHIRTTVATYPAEDEIVIIVDQLNTHKSATLVELISEICFVKDPFVKDPLGETCFHRVLQSDIG